MPLASRLAFQFDQRVQFRGLGLFRDRAVRVVEESPSHLHALVTGGSLYDVRVTHDNGRLFVSCGCPYFSDYGQCKHLWAALLEADRRGALSEALNAKYLTIEDDSDIDDDDDHPAYTYSSGSLPPLPPPPRIPAWQEQLRTIRREVEQKRLPTAAWPREFEIVYVIDLASSRASAAIVIELFSRSRKKNGEWTVLKWFRVTPAQAGSLPDPIDAETIAAMLGGQEYFPYQYYSAGASATRKALPASLALKLIPAIAATGRLRMRTDAGSTDLQPVVWDSGEPWKLWLKVWPRGGTVEHRGLASPRRGAYGVESAALTA